jgi:hypothetical protein
VSETEVEMPNDALGDSPGGTLVEMLGDRTDDVLVRDPVAKLLVSPLAIDDEVMGVLVSKELDDADGDPSVPVGGGNVLLVRVIGNPSVPVLSGA